MGPSKDTHGTLRPDQREARKHPKHGSGAMSIHGKSTDDER